MLSNIIDLFYCKYELLFVFDKRYSDIHEFK